MTDIAKMLEAVETGRAAYARASKQHASSRKHVLSLIRMVEEQLRDKRTELSQIDVQREHMIRECDQIQQMLDSLGMAVEGGAAEIPGDELTAIEARSDGVMPLAPVAVASEPKVPAAEAARAEAEITGAGPVELRAGLKHILKKMRVPADKPETDQTNGSKTPNPAE